MKSEIKPDLQRVINRNFIEANNAILKLVAYDTLVGELKRQDFTFAGMSFFCIAMQALYNDMLSHTMKILDKHRDACGIYYIMDEANKINSNATENATGRAKVDLNELESLAEKIKCIRDKTHFHLDRATINNSNGVWEVADIDGGLLERSLKAIARLLPELNNSIGGDEDLKVTKYEGSDIAKIIEAFNNFRQNVRGV